MIISFSPGVSEEMAKMLELFFEAEVSVSISDCATGLGMETTLDCIKLHTIKVTLMVGDNHGSHYNEPTFHEPVQK